MMSIIVLQLILLSLCYFMHTMAATKHDLNIMSMNMNVIQAKSSFSPSSIPVQFTDFAFYSYQFSSSSEDKAKDDDSSRRNMQTNTFSLEFSSQATSSSFSYLRHK